MHQTHKTSIVNSALWAAYGDALGFISEFADTSRLAYRTGARKITRTLPWKRRVGGRFGVTLNLPAGCYSDDTQLRLATSRAIRSDGHFDVEAFAKIELPVWLAYSLGGGQSTKAAAWSLARGDVNWFSNFFARKSTTYFDAGGNGAAMRIQPHVWAGASAQDPRAFLGDVIRNTICTHGHPRALAGSVFHAICLMSAIANSEIPGPAAWREAISSLSEIPSLIREDDELSTFWFPVWSQRAPTQMDTALRAVQQESMADISIIERESPAGGEAAYQRILSHLGALEPATRGSGIKTALLASAISWLFRGKPAAFALLTAANALGSDTDSIGTMAGAILGSVERSSPDGDIADREYIAEEASRLSQIALGTPSDSFAYPDPMVWRPPRVLTDAVGLINGRLALAGLGAVDPVGTKWQDSRDKSVSWQWLRLKFGQTVLARQRQALNEMPGERQTQGKAESLDQGPRGGGQVDRQTQLFRESQDRRSPRRDTLPSGSSLDELTSAAINSGFDFELIGRHLVELAATDNGVELAIAYSAIIAKAKRARIRANSGKEHRKE